MKLKDGGYLQFHDVDFDGGTTLELRLDNPAGTLIGAAKVDGGHGKTAYTILTGPVNAAAREVHDLCLVARGEGGDAQGHLFNLTWFAFTKR